MKKSFYFLCTLALTGTLFSCNPTENEPAETDYTKYVNTFIGAADNGHTFPGACRPFGMIQTSPVTGAVGWRYCSEYVNSDSIIWGSLRHISTEPDVWTWATCSSCLSPEHAPVPGMPTAAVLQEAGSRHTGYYTVELTEPNVKAELTATPHAALHRYTYHNADSASVLIDLQHGPTWNENQYHSQVKECEVNWEDAQT